MNLRFPVLVAAAIAMASPAFSLSCMRPDVARTFNFAAEAEESYIVVHGKLTFNASKLPKATGNNSPRSTKISARIEGNSLTQSGFQNRFERNVTLDVGCLGPWCAGASSGQDYLAFLRKDGSGYTLSIDPCGGMGFAEPTPEMLQKVAQCMAGGACKPATR